MAEPRDTKRSADTTPGLSSPAAPQPEPEEQGSGGDTVRFEGNTPPAVESPGGALDGSDNHRLEGRLVAVRYKVIRKIGEGGMGSVYLAEHVTIQKKVALKVLLPEHTRASTIKERFLQEAKAAARIGHENIVDIIDFGTTPDGSLFFAMEYLEGQDLARVLQMGGPFRWGRAKPILLQVCRALDAAHGMGIVHRDLKPENILLEEREGREDFVKLLDFGIAKVGDGGTSRLTKTGMIFGTPQYMSPEQALGRKPDNRVDIYSLGVIMYEMLTGQVPFSADTFMEVLGKHISEAPAPPQEVNPGADIPDQVQQIILKALAKNPEHRFQSMSELAVAVSRTPGRAKRPTSKDPAYLPFRPSDTLPDITEPDAGQAPTIVGAPPEVEAPRGRRWIWLALAAVLVLGALAGVLVLAPGSGEQQAPAAASAPPAPEQEQPAVASPASVDPPPPQVAATPESAASAPAPAARPDAGTAARTAARPGPQKTVARRQPPRPRTPAKPASKAAPGPPPAKTRPSESVPDLLDPFKEP